MAVRRPTFIDLFAGIGGISLGLERAGFCCAAHVEVDYFCQRVLRRHWPDVPLFGDIRTLDPRDLPAVDLIAGGFPCQPVSAAGRQKAQEDPRWLWPEFARVLRQVRPQYAFLENVPALLTVAGGRAAQEVFGDLADLGFDAEWFVLPAAAVGAPHLRKRVFVVAHAQQQQLRDEPGGSGGACGPDQAEPGDDGQERSLAHAQRQGPQGLRPERGLGEGGRPLQIEWRRQLADADDSGWDGGPGEFGKGRRSGDSDRRPAEGDHWAVEPDVGRVAHGVPDRMDRLRALGNAVVPQVAEAVGRWILAGGRERRMIRV